MSISNKKALFLTKLGEAVEQLNDVLTGETQPMTLTNYSMSYDLKWLPTCDRQVKQLAKKYRG